MLTEFLVGKVYDGPRAKTKSLKPSSRTIENGCKSLTIIFKRSSLNRFYLLTDAGLTKYDDIFSWAFFLLTGGKWVSLTVAFSCGKRGTKVAAVLLVPGLSSATWLAGIVSCTVVADLGFFFWYAYVLACNKMLSFMIFGQVRDWSSFVR